MLMLLIQESRFENTSSKTRNPGALHILDVWQIHVYSFQKLCGLVELS